MKIKARRIPDRREECETAPEERASIRYAELPVDLIVPNPSQPRKHFDEERIAELAASIREVGLIQPLIVRRRDGRYELIAGERRLRALRLLGQPFAKCVIEDELCEADRRLTAVIENVQREDLHFFEEAESYRELLELLGITQEELAGRLGKSQSFIANKLRLLKFGKASRDAVLKSGLSERHARAVLRLPTEDLRLSAIGRIQTGALSVNESEKLVDRLLDEASRTGASRPRPKMIRIFRDYRLFINTVDTACAQLRESGLKVLVDRQEIENGISISITVTQ